jgi:hypothetical protein
MLLVRSRSKLSDLTGFQVFHNECQNHRFENQQLLNKRACCLQRSGLLERCVAQIGIGAPRLTRTADQTGLDPLSCAVPGPLSLSPLLPAAGRATIVSQRIVQLTQLVNGLRTGGGHIFAEPGKSIFEKGEHLLDKGLGLRTFVRHCGLLERGQNETRPGKMLASSSV